MAERFEARTDMIFSILTMFWARNYNNQTDEQYYDT